MGAPDKATLREALVAARRALHADERAARSRAAAVRLAELEPFRRARVVALYAPMGAELDTAEVARLADAAGKRLAFPRLVAGERALAFATCTSEALVEGALRTREPPPGAIAVAPDEIDLVVVPGVAFDAAGHRLGRGRGHYDATLAALPEAAFRVGLAFDLQVVDAVPREPHDAQLDAVVTEARVLFPLTPRRPSGMASRP